MAAIARLLASWKSGPYGWINSTLFLRSAFIDQPSHCKNSTRPELYAAAAGSPSRQPPANHRKSNDLHRNIRLTDGSALAIAIIVPMWVHPEFRLWPDSDGRPPPAKFKGALPHEAHFLSYAGGPQPRVQRRLLLKEVRAAADHADHRKNQRA